jgi:hypothetical protein
VIRLFQTYDTKLFSTALSMESHIHQRTDAQVVFEQLVIGGLRSHAFDHAALTRGKLTDEGIPDRFFPMGDAADVE